MSRADARRVLAELQPSVGALVAKALDGDAADAFLARLDHSFPDAWVALEGVFGEDHDVTALLDGLLARVVDAAAARPADLRRLDRRREIDPDWFLHERMVGYVCYADRFAGDLQGVRQHLDYLAELGVTYLHLMPLLEPRPKPNDGGYAVASYSQVDPRLGSMDDLEALAGDLRARGMSLCVDVVVNHTAREHRWAQAALAGDPAYLGYYLTFPDRMLPDAYERTLPEVFPDIAPGSFTWVEEMQRWVWTTFNAYQWDLDHSNPAVFAAMLDVLLTLGNRGVDVLRLDAVPFLWKRLGTDCQNQPEAHLLLRAWRALMDVAMPAVIFKGEAIVHSDELVRYLGAGEIQQRECELAYHNQLMAQSWSAVATRDAALAQRALSRMARPPSSTTWVTYVRCHDDIGWAVGEEDAAAVGWGGSAHRRFLSDFFAGDFPGSFARGARFQPDPATGEARTSGMAATLCGIEAALDAGADPSALDDVARLEALQRRQPNHPNLALDLGVRRLLMLYAVAFSYGGIPLIWMGDELALTDDRGFAADPEHAPDNRWLHRPRLDWKRAARRAQPGTLEHRVFTGIARLARLRAATPQLRSGADVRLPDIDERRVLAYARYHPRRGRFLGLANFSAEPVSVGYQVVPEVGLRVVADVLGPDGYPGIEDGYVSLGPLQVRWLVPA